MKRFWTEASAVPVDGGWAIELDGKRVHTPGRMALVVPSQRLAEAIADEWNESGETVEPRAMPLTGMANAAIERIAADSEAFVSGLSSYGESDLTCYRAQTPRELVARQEQAWEPLLAWARRRFDVHLLTTAGIVHVPQSVDSVERLRAEVESLDPFRLAGLALLVTIGGSLVAALAVLEGTMSAEAAWEAVTLDEQWQAEQWGLDVEAEAALARRRSDFLSAARFLGLLD